MRWEELSYPHHAELAASNRVALLPLGALEAHGPHLPVGTDLWISEAMAREAARLLRERGVASRTLPSIPYAPAPFADGFAGTLSIRPATLTALVVDLAGALGRRGVEVLALANSHFDPAQIAALRLAAGQVGEQGGPRLVYPDLTRRTYAARLTDEFRSGACHAGRFESSILLAERPELVDDAGRRALPARDVSLSEAIRQGRTSFERAGLDAAYCGDPAAATAEEGRAIVATLGELLAEAVLQALDGRAGGDASNKMA
jgi:creatinine amidohydrolase